MLSAATRIGTTPAAATPACGPGAKMSLAYTTGPFSVPHCPAMASRTTEGLILYGAVGAAVTGPPGSLQDAGNTSTLSGYLNLLAESGLLYGLQKYSIDVDIRRAGIPKLRVYNNALKMYTTRLLIRLSLTGSLHASRFPTSLPPPSR